MPMSDRLDALGHSARLLEDLETAFDYWCEDGAGARHPEMKHAERQALVAILEHEHACYSKQHELAWRACDHRQHATPPPPRWRSEHQPLPHPVGPVYRPPNVWESVWQAAPALSRKPRV